jgi:hypothetical protein
MHHIPYCRAAFTIVLVCLVPLSYSLADDSHIRFDNENWDTLPHPQVAEFTVHEDGSANGMTENGIPFAQYNVPNQYGIRVQRFEIEDHYHYIVEGEIANSFEEMSVLLSEAYARTSST